MLARSVGRLALAVQPMALVAWLGLATTALAASPSPSRPTSNDTRSPLEGPGFVGSPGMAILVVVLIAIVAILATWAYVRLTGGATSPDDASHPPKT